MIPTPFPWYRLPQIELARFKAIDFFPPKPARMEDLRSICIGTKNRTIGDALVLSSLPRLLKQSYPSLKIVTYPRGFNPVVFWNNPYVDGITFLPDALYGDDNNEGSGQLIHRKEKFFGVESDSQPKPELYLTEAELKWGEAFVRDHSPPTKGALPLLIIHSFGRTVGNVLTPDVWSRFVREQSPQLRIAQVGVEGQPRIEGCDFYFLSKQTRGSARQLFALMRQADRFIGVDSGPMHIARAFGARSLIIMDEAPPDEIFRKRHETPGVPHGKPMGAFLYEDFEHVYVPTLDASSIVRKMSEFALRA